MKKLHMMIAFHKEYFNIDTEAFSPLHVGAGLSTASLGIDRDDTGTHISHKNRNYCELTGLYWMWKNIDAEYYGLMHYRRYFTAPRRGARHLVSELDFLRKKIKSRLSKSYKLSRNTLSRIDSPRRARKQIDNLELYLEKNLEKYDILFPEPILYRVPIKSRYAAFHRIDDLELLRSIIRDETPENLESFDDTMEENLLYPYNMFVMKSEFFHEYASLLFRVLFALETSITLDPDDAYQARVFGFLSERLLGVYLKQLRKEHRNFRFGELPVAFFQWN